MPQHIPQSDTDVLITKPFKNLLPVEVGREIYRFPFLAHDSCEKMISSANDALFVRSSVRGGYREYLRTSRSLFLKSSPNEIFQGFLTYAVSALSEITEYIWNWQCNTLTDTAILEYAAGTYYREHIDASSSKLQAKRHVSFLIYLSDDFEGGETYFSRQDVMVIPKKSDAIVFPAGITHPHEALTVRSGVKYVIAGWLTQI